MLFEHTYKKFSNNNHVRFERGIKMDKRLKEEDYIYNENGVKEITQQIMDAYDSGHMNDNVLNNLEDHNK